jgi:hypothetical protein
MDSESRVTAANVPENAGGTIQENAPGDTIDRAAKVWGETAGERTDREISRLEKYLNEKEARDPAYRSEREAARQKSETYERLEADLESAAGEAAEWEGSQALRRELEGLYPGKAPLDVVDTWLKLNQSYVADPGGTAEWHMQQLLAEAPVIAQARKELPQDGSFDSAWRRAGEHINERDAWTAIMDYARQNGISVREGLAQIIHHTKEGRRDPVYATARMAAQAGLAVTPMAQEAAALNEVQTAEHEALADGAQGGLEAVAREGRLPGLDRTELQDTMADIIEHETFQSTGDLQNDLWNAYHLALHAENDKLRETQAGETKRKANLSIGGGTPTGAGARSVPTSSGEAIDRAFADLGG